MNGFSHLLCLLAISAALLLPDTIHACPFCKDAIAAPADGSTEVIEEDDPFREAQAYNYSIYTMVAMPYLLLGTFGFLVYRGLKRKALAEQQAADTASSERNAAGGEGDRPCPDLSHGEIS